MSTQYLTVLGNIVNFRVHGQVGICPAGEYQPGQRKSEYINSPTSLQCVSDTITTIVLKKQITRTVQIVTYTKSEKNLYARMS